MLRQTFRIIKIWNEGPEPCWIWAALENEHGPGPYGCLLPGTFPKKVDNCSLSATLPADRAITRSFWKTDLGKSGHSITINWLFTYPWTCFLASLSKFHKQKNKYYFTECEMFVIIKWVNSCETFIACLLMPGTVLSVSYYVHLINLTRAGMFPYGDWNFGVLWETRSGDVLRCWPMTQPVCSQEPRFLAKQSSWSVAHQFPFVCNITTRKRSKKTLWSFYLKYPFQCC